jgi:hypothetical protein
LTKGKLKVAGYNAGYGNVFVEIFPAKRKPVEAEGDFP